MLEYGADINRKGKSHGTPLGLATYLSSQDGADMYKLLLEYDASTNIKDCNYYIIKDYVKYIRMLNTKN